MRISTILIAVLFVVLVGGTATWYYSTYEQTRRAMLSALEQISESATAMDGEALDTQIATYLGGESAMKLNVSYQLFGVGSSGNRPWSREFKKQEFADFITETTNRVETYGMLLTLDTLELLDDDTRYKAVISTAGFGTRKGNMAGQSVGSRYTISGDCVATGSIAKPLMLAHLDCDLHMNQKADVSAGQARQMLNNLKGLKP